MIIIPRYKYRKENGEEIIIQHSVDELPLEEHPETGEELERVFDIGSVLFKYKGSGFHATDYDKDGEAYNEDIMENKRDDNIDTYTYD